MSGRRLGPVPSLDTLIHQARRAWSPLSRGAGEELRAEKRLSPSPTMRERVPTPGLQSGGRRVRGFAGIILCVIILTLDGCGKRNAPTAPPDVPNTYPRPYPSE
jgi:hypothetical protein